MKVSIIWHITRDRNWPDLICLGCMSNYMPECGDSSDVFVCPAKACENDTTFFPCQDGKYCIFVDLVCDGHEQCEDGSGMSRVI